MASQPVPRKSNASRYLFLFLVGLMAGAFVTVMAMRALQARQDPFPHSMMHVLQKHSGQLAQTLQQNRCAATDTVPHLRTLRAMANDLEMAYPGLAEDARFATHASQFRARLDSALAAPPTDCASAGRIAEQVKESCSGCHQDFRG